MTQLMQNLALQYRWHRYTDGKLGEIVERPAGYKTIFDNDLSIDPFDFPFFNNQNLQNASFSGVSILSGGKGGLWKMTNNNAPVAIVPDGFYSNIFVTAAGRWAVAFKQTAERTAVRINLETGKEYKLAEDRQFLRLINIPPLGKLLVLTMPIQQPNSANGVTQQGPQYSLLSADTGRLEPVNGEFRPFDTLRDGFFQTSNKSNEYWVAMPSDTRDSTDVGRYDIRTFKFEKVLTVPKLEFKSEEMWVDESGGKIYIVHSGDLLRIPLSPPAKPVNAPVK